MNDSHRECLQQNWRLWRHGYQLFYSFSLVFLMFLISAGGLLIVRQRTRSQKADFDEIIVLVQTSMFLTSSLNATDEPLSPSLSHRATKLYALLVLLSLNASDEPSSRLREGGPVFCSCGLKIGASQRSLFLVLTERIAVSGNENVLRLDLNFQFPVPRSRKNLISTGYSKQFDFGSKKAPI